jgi:ADP-ribosylglycohydrolase
MNIDANVLARALGCWLGQLAGDSLGSLVEFHTGEAIRARYPEGVRDLRNGGVWRTRAGQPTDDSELALMLARTLVRDGRYDPGAVLEAYVHWYESGPFDVGTTIRQALGAAARGRTRAERLELATAAADAGRPSNGSLMRISPLGVFGAGRPAAAAALARQDSRLTHPHPLCQDACAVFLAALATAVADGGGPEAAYAAARAEAARPEVQGPVREALDQARLGPPADFFTQQGYVLIALRNAFYQVLHAPNLEEGVVATVMAGGDTDTNAAIAGALLGAVYGRDAVPARWQQAVLTCRPQPPRVPGSNERPRPPEFWPADALELAEALLRAGLNAPLPPGP